MTSASFFALFALIGIINGAAIKSGSGNIAYEIPIPRGYTAQEYFKSVADYWTPERMAAATPMQQVMTTREVTPFVNDDKNDEAERLLVPSVPAPNVLARKDPTPPACGRIFFSMGNLNYVCSGSSANSNNRQTVISAGHCVYNNTGKQWAEKLTFVPDYHQGDTPHGKFPARRLATKEEWKAKVDYNNDVAIITVNNNEKGERLQDVVGGVGILLNPSKTGATNAFGFPMNINNGENMSTCAASTTAANILLMGSFKGISLQCGMGGGASGGPWFRSYNHGTKVGDQCSLTSFGHSFAPGKIQGPHFTQENIGSLFQANQNA